MAAVACYLVSHLAVGVLRDLGNLIALLQVEDMYRPDKATEGKLVFGGDPVRLCAAGMLLLILCGCVGV